MTDKIIITKNITPSKLGDLFDEIVHQNSDDNILILPSRLDKYRFGLLADILRLIITFNRKNSIKTVKIDVKKDDIDKFYDQEYAYPIISLLWNTSTFVDKEDNLIKGLLRRRQNEFFLKMNSLSRMKGNK